MNLVVRGASPWGQPIILHAAWSLLWLCLAGAAAFVVVHALWAGRRAGAPAGPVPPELAGAFPGAVARHSFVARVFHWLMAACVLTLLATAFSPRFGLAFDWVGPHVLAGAVLVAAIAFHIAHAITCQDVGAIWPVPADWPQLRAVLFPPRDGAAMPRAGKYPLGNKLFHLGAVVVGLTLAATGTAMLWRVRTPFVTRDPYRVFGDGGWGVVYALHGLAAMALAGLVVIHVYFAIRPEKRPITRSMLVGTMDRDFYLGHHDPARWGGEGPAPKEPAKEAGSA
ncbi:MAG: cytochrome b/b6 domain-containing protein [Solidesulfovibrio sp. DCME]|uniref:cytochrome b/b6 domain-containing protein n=1 Tax=Solidesulfovibrio sp. DCME TaxID=3447380 RepID=UPI003D1352CB